MSVSPKKRAQRAAEKVTIAAQVTEPLRIALIGRPNVGKSSLFNKLVGKRAAIVSPVPGTTRDWREMEANIGDLPCIVMDTGGLEDQAALNSVEAKMLQHTSKAIEHADVVLFVMDARAGVTDEDVKFVRWLKRVRKDHRSIRLLANKAEALMLAGDNDAATEQWDALQHDALQLGLGDPTAISAEHGDGLSDLYLLLREHALQPRQGASAPSVADSDSQRHIELAIVGRPNVGKSSIVNQLLGEERVLAGPTPGLTRDASEFTLTCNDRTIRLVDTAGMRRWGAWDLTTPLEGQAVGAAKRALERAHVVAMVVDASAGSLAGLQDAAATATAPHNLSSIVRGRRLRGSPAARGTVSEADVRSGATSGTLTRQDLSIVQQVLDEGRALIILLNKIDTVRDRASAVATVHEQLQRMHEARGVEVLAVSATQRRGIESILPTVVRVNEKWNTRVTTSHLNTWLAAITRVHPAPSITVSRKKRGGGDDGIVSRSIQLRIKYMAQTGVRPPTFTAYVNRSPLPETYVRFILNAMREEFKLQGVPIRLHFKTATNPYAKRSAATKTTLAKHTDARRAQATWRLHQSNRRAAGSK